MISNPMIPNQDGSKTYGIYYTTADIYSISINGVGYDNPAGTGTKYAMDVAPGTFVSVETVIRDGYSVTTTESETPVPTSEGAATYAPGRSVMFYFVMPQEDVIINYS